jgi:TRAP-type C4-dicarboxylate transport system permease small subunit
MTPTLITVGRRLRRLAEHVAALLLATMFIAFLIQIVFRYVFNWPAGWAFELSILCWLWGVLWGAAFVVQERDEIRFDVIYGAVRPGVRRIFVLISGIAMLAIYGMSLPAVTDYVTFMKVERSAYLKIGFNWLYSVFVIFAVATLVRYAWLVCRALRGGETPSAGAGEARGS